METIKFGETKYQLKWFQSIIPPGGKVTQVSGYIFDNEGKVLIVKVGGNWTVPGGKPEAGETPLDTLQREVDEEACVEIHKEIPLGYIEVVPENQPEEIHFQLRFAAQVSKLRNFHEEFEATERKFVAPDDLKQYIKWFDSVVFQHELKAAINSIQKCLIG